MRASSIKNRINTLSTHHFTYNQYPTVQSPQAHDLSKLPQDYHNKNNYQSNYHYFANRIGLQNTNQIEKNQKITHQRYMSLGNSRATARNSQNSESSPYLMHFGTNERIKTVQTPKFTQKNWQQKLINVNSESNINRVPMKMSMKISQRKQVRENNEKYYFMRESQVSTVNQTNNTGSMSSKLAQQKLKKDQLIKYLSLNLQNSFNELKNQIKLQNKMIQKLEQKIGKLNTNLLEKEKVISTLLNSPQKQPHFMQNTLVQKCNQLVIKSITSKIKNLQAFNQSIKNKLAQQSDIQVEINKKIDKLIIELEKAEKNNVQREHWSSQIRNVVLKVDKFKNYLIQNKNLMQQIQEMKKVASNLKQMCGLLKKKIVKTQASSNEMQETAKFKIDMDHSSAKMKCENELLNDSASYFFHPSQLSNIQKITELFINRQGQPIQCYVDNLNQVRYKDTNTFMFNKKGDIVQLSECQKRYYIDKGFIVKNK